MSWLAATEYLRLFWWYAAIVPLFGLLLLIFSQGPLQMIGMMALLWPLTIPGRSFLSSSKSSRLFTQPCFMEANDEAVVFYSVSEEPKRKRFAIPAADIRDIVERADILLLRTRRFGIAPVKRASFSSQEDEDAFFKVVAGIVHRRYEEP